MDYGENEYTVKEEKSQALVPEDIGYMIREAADVLKHDLSKDRHEMSLRFLYTHLHMRIVLSSFILLVKKW